MKRTMDIIISSLLIVFLFPLMLLIFFLVAVFIGGFPLFAQTRVGKGGRLFKMLKFKTMPDNPQREKGLTPVPEAEIPLFGRVLRKTGLDELPQLFNVLAGDMSLVGPRPALPFQAVRYNSRQAARLLVLPGITGLAQIHGRSEIPWERRYEYDIEYIRRRSVILDLKIILRTFLLLFSQLRSIWK